MVVDDNPANLKLLEDMLRQKGYLVRSFPRGRMALAAAAENPPDLILLDVNMPEMNGYELCEHLNSTEEFSGIPVLFISALNETEDKVKGFRSGGVDYISKPFQFEEVHARVETHLELCRAQQAEQQLLEQTLNGAIRMLSDLVHAASPELAARSREIRACVTWIAQQMGLGETWKFDLAATLCLLGCIALPEETFHRAYLGETVSVEEAAMFQAHPHGAATLLANIPRLEAIAEMIRLQQTSDLHPSVSEEIRLGARLLHLAVELDRRIYRGLTLPIAFQQIKSMPNQFDAAMLDALRAYSPASAEFHHQTVLVKQLFAGMILEEDVSSAKNGLMIFRKGTVLSETWIERLRNFAKSQGVKEPIRVRAPGPTRTPVFQGPIRGAQRNKKDNSR